MNRFRSGSICIDVSELIDAISDDDLLDEVALRKLVAAPDGIIEVLPMELVKEAHAELICGRVAEALSILERLVNPKWRDRKAAQSAYEKRALL